jgi:hypothetical protein
MRAEEEERYKGLLTQKYTPLCNVEVNIERQ